MKVKKSDGTWATLYTKPIGDTLPIGTVTQYGGSTAPTNWLFCNGQAVSRTTYKLLFDVIGTTYGSGDGSTTFNLPDFRSRLPIGIGAGTDGTNDEKTALGQKKGEYKHKLTIDKIPSHNHSSKIAVNLGSTSGPAKYFFAAAGTTNTPSTDAATWSSSIVGNNTGGGQAHNNIQPSLGINFIIKYDNSVGLTGTVVNDITNPNKDAVPTAKTVKKYVDDHAGSANIIKTGITDPNTETVGNFVGQIYCNTRKDTAYQLVSITKIDGETYYNWTKLVRGNEKVTSLSSNSTDEQYPTAKAVKDYVDKKQTYSTNETVVGTWIDGKPIYRKVYEISSLPNKGRMYVDCNIPNVQHVITMRGVMESSTEWDSMPSAYTNGTLIDSLVIERTGNTLTRIRILNNFDRSKFSAFVILEYTKITD